MPDTPSGLEKAGHTIRTIGEPKMPENLPTGWSWGRSHHKLRIGIDWDVGTLLDLHNHLTGDKRGRRPREGVQVLHRSAVLLSCAYWEAFCEDLAAEVLVHLAAFASIDELPAGLKTTIANNLKNESHQHAVWKLADDGWRGLLRNRAKVLQSGDDRKFTTPRTNPTREHFRREIGFEDVPKYWSWHRNSVEDVAVRLDEFVDLRNSIAHRGEPPEAVTKRAADRGRDLVTRLAAATAEAVWRSTCSVTGHGTSSYAPGDPIETPDGSDLRMPRPRRKKASKAPTTETS